MARPDITAYIAANDKAFHDAMQRVRRDARGASIDAKQSFAGLAMNMAGYGKAAVTGFVGGIVAGGIGGVVSQIGEVAKGIASVGDEAKRAGLSNQAFQELGYIAKANRIEVGALTDGMKELALRADEYIVTGKGSAAESFQRLGISAQELKKKLQDPSALFSEIIGKLGQLDRAAQIRISDELFGGTGGEQFVQLIAQGEEGIEALVREAHTLGAVMSDDLIERAAELDRRFNAVATTVGTALKTAIVEAASELGKFIDSFRAMEDRATSSLKDRFNLLQTRMQQLKEEEGSTGDKVRQFLGGGSAAAERQAVLAEMDQLAAQLRQRATSQLREKLTEQNVANRPYVAPPDHSGARAKNAKAADTERERVARLIEELEEELRLVGASEEAKRAAEAARRAGAKATDEERQKIVDLTVAIYRETQAHERAKKELEARTEAWSNIFDMAGESLGDIADNSVKAEDAIKKLAVQLAIAAAQAAILGTGPLAGLLGGGLFGGSSSSSGNGFAEMLGIPSYASGTNNHPGGLARINDGAGGEIVDLPDGSRVIPHDVSVKAARAGMAVQVNYSPVYNFEGTGAEVETFKREMEKRDQEFSAKVIETVRKAQSTRNL